MLQKEPLVAFVATTDADVAREFYERTLGLDVISADQFAIVCNANGVTLRIQKVEFLQPQAFTVLGWAVANLPASVDELVKHGVQFQRYPGMAQDERGIWQAPSGTRVAWFKDPDGNTLSLSQA
jgi:catechol 2,3-dioxygenase-like lactoylglutathione lyase family enzyme